MDKLKRVLSGQDTDDQSGLAEVAPRHLPASGRPGPEPPRPEMAARGRLAPGPGWPPRPLGGSRAHGAAASRGAKTR